jgi:signal recognition particle subunit SRP19
MSHARIEEVSDSGTEPEEDSDQELDSDPDIEDIDTLVPAPKPTNPQAFQRPVTTSRPDPGFDANTAKRWVCLYPVYFDASRSRAEGRRVSKKLAVANPLARTMADACAGVGLRVFIDVGKTHPKDWANPGRVKVELKDEEGELMRRDLVKNSMPFILQPLPMDKGS